MTGICTSFLVRGTTLSGSAELTTGARNQTPELGSARISAKVNHYILIWWFLSYTKCGCKLNKGLFRNNVLIYFLTTSWLIPGVASCLIILF